MRFVSTNPAHTRYLTPAVLQQAWPKARDYLLLQKRELSGTEECDKRRRGCAGMESSLPVPPTLFLNNLFKSD